jgi:3-oxoacyl-[acyl-carrier protein] reductase
MLLQGKKIILTGGSRGIGKSCVEYLAAQGAKVAFTHTGSGNSAAVESFETELRSKGCDVKAFAVNLSEVGSFKEKISQMTDYLGGLDGLVNNAGITSDNLILRMKEEEFDKTLDVNLKGAYFFTKECLRSLMRSESSTSVVFMSSVVGVMGNSGQSAYAASKAGLVGLAKSLAKELASRQLRVNVIAPGFIQTEMTGVLDESVKKSYMDNIPLGRFGEAVEVAQAVTFLLSDMSRYITGQVLNINGGLYI